MAIRRVVTGLSPKGQSTVASDGAPTRSVDWRPDAELELHWIWSTDGTPVVPPDGHDPARTFTSFFPGPGGSRFMVEVFPPGFGVEGIQLGERDALGEAGITATMEVGEDGAHATSTIDYGVVVSGSIWLDLEDGSETELRAGDCFVQTGVTHTWRNRGSDPCTVAFVLIGATGES